MQHTIKHTLTYPFIPRSTAALLPGHFWAIPLSDGSFGCGRVIQLAQPKTVGARVMFLAGLLDWHADVIPTSERIAGVACLDQGQAHIRTILATGGSILGYRPLELDGIQPWAFRGATIHVGSSVYHGLHPVRPQEPADEILPVLSTWGNLIPALVAEERWGRM